MLLFKTVSNDGMAVVSTMLIVDTIFYFFFTVPLKI